MESVSSMAMRGSLRQCQFLSDRKNSCERAVEDFCSAVKQRALKKSSILLRLPFLPRRNGSFSSVVNEIQTWPRRASRGSRERPSPNAQPAPFPAAACLHCRSFPAPGLPFASFDVTQPRSKYSSDILKTSSRPTSEELAAVGALPATTPPPPPPPPINNAASSDYDIYWNDVQLLDFAMKEERDIYIMEGVSEVQQRRNCCSAPEMPQTDAWLEDLQESVGILTACTSAPTDSSVTTLSENETASTAALESDPIGAVENRSRRRRFRGIRQKDNKWISEIRPSCAKRTVWLGTYATEEEAARAFDAGIFYYRKFNIPYNFPDSPQVLAQVDQGPQEVNVKFVKIEARRNAERVRWQSSASSSAAAAAAPSSPQQLSTTTAIQEQQQQQASSSSDSSRGWFRGCRGRKSYSQ